MKIKEVFPELLYDGAKIHITLQKGENQAVADFIKDCGIIDQDAEYELTLKKKRRKRSLDANAYFWVLVGKLAQKLHGKSKQDIYRAYIKETGAYETMPVREDTIAHWCRLWESHGDGWVAEDMGECRNIKGYHYVRCYYGSSMYDSAEMNHLIDMVVQDCKAQGIETMTPDELERLKAEWKQNIKG